MYSTEYLVAGMGLQYGQLSASIDIWLPLLAGSSHIGSDLFSSLYCGIWIIFKFYKCLQVLRIMNQVTLYWWQPVLGSSDKSSSGTGGDGE
jgi:hypothetical protein